MKYNPPAGEAAGAAYVDGNRSAGTKGSIVPAAAIEHPQREIDHVIDFFGLTPSPSDLQQLRKAIEKAIEAATGEGEASQYLLVSQARARLPIFPDVQSSDGKINVTSPSSGTVLVPASVSFQHRGIYPVSTSDYIEGDRTFATLANKTYHLRWNPTDGFTLEDLADSGYNPSVLAESATAFDTTYDDMLVARIVTNVSNVATITNLVNKERSSFYEYRVVTTGMTQDGSPGFGVDSPPLLFTYNHARKPSHFSPWGALLAGSVGPNAGIQGGANLVTEPTVNRYSCTFIIFSDFEASVSNFSVYANLSAAW